MNAIENIVKMVTELKKELEEMPETKEAKPVSREEFTLLLSGISTCRKAPGIPVHMGYEELYHCADADEEAKTREHLQRIYGIQNEEAFQSACHSEYSGSRQYEQFMTFWCGAPMFDINELNGAGRKGFEECISLSRHFYPILKEKGYYAWDINEKIGLLRKAAACGIVSEERFWELTDPWVRQAQVFYHSWQEYAISCLCGAVYFMSHHGTVDESFYKLNYNLVRHLFEDGGAWRRNAWYRPQEREWADIFGANPGCIITKRAMETETIGYMYRDEPAKGFPDCGWRFFVGDEPDEYVNQAENNTIISFNTVCNLDPTILAYFYADAGRKFGRTEDGWEEEF